MTPIEKIAAGLASDLARRAEIHSPEIQALLSDAFRRGLSLGRTIRDSRAFAITPRPTSRPTEPAPWTPMY